MISKRALSFAQLIAVVAIAFCAYAVLGRLFYRCEFEWMTGAIFDHIERINQGLPVYTKPSTEWVPFLYPPLYYAIVAPLTKIFPGYVPARLVSIAATLVQGACLWRLAGHYGATRTWRFIGLGVFAAAFSYTGYWYDLERVDPLFVALLMCAIVLVVERVGIASAALAGTLVGIAFFAKQPAVVFAAAGVTALVLVGQWKRAAAFGGLAGLVMITGFMWMQSKTDGWFAYYILKMPGAHGIDRGLFRPLFLEDIPKAFSLVVATGVLAARAWRLRASEEGKREIPFVLVLLAAGFASASSRLHIGGWDNVLMFFSSFGAVAVAIVGSRLTEQYATSPFGFVVPIAAALQMIIWAYDPTQIIPPRSTVREARRFEEKVAELEKEGDVLVLTRGNVATKRHYHLAAVVDVFRTDNKVPDEISQPFRDRKFAAVVFDTFDDLYVPIVPSLKGSFFTTVMAHYYVAERLDERLPDPQIGFKSKPRIVLKPRKEPLDERDPERIRRRARLERTIAEGLERASRAGASNVPATVDIEALAKDLDAKAYDGITPAPKYLPDDYGR